MPLPIAAKREDDGDGPDRAGGARGGRELLARDAQERDDERPGGQRDAADVEGVHGAQPSVWSCAPGGPRLRASGPGRAARLRCAGRGAAAGAGGGADAGRGACRRRRHRSRPRRTGGSRIAHQTM